MTRATANDPQQRRDRRTAARTDRKRTEAQREQRQRLARMAGWGLIGLVVAGIAGWFIYVSFLKEYPGQSVASLGNRHVAASEEATYNSNPPTSGPHLPNLASWGVHKEPVADNLQVHNLEDGGVVIQYNCEDCGDMVQQLEGLVNGYMRGGKSHMLLAPRKDMDAKIALTAWGRIDKLQDYDEARIRKFVDAYHGIDHHPRGGE